MLTILIDYQKGLTLYSELHELFDDLELWFEEVLVSDRFLRRPDHTRCLSFRAVLTPVPFKPCAQTCCFDAPFPLPLSSLLQRQPGFTRSEIPQAPCSCVSSRPYVGCCWAFEFVWPRSGREGLHGSWCMMAHRRIFWPHRLSRILLDA